jgi:hypothetical protein
MMAETVQYEAEATDGSGTIIRFTAPKNANPEDLQIIAERLTQIENKAKQAGTLPGREPGEPPVTTPMEPPEMPAQPPIGGLS